MKAEESGAFFFEVSSLAEGCVGAFIEQFGSEVLPKRKPLQLEAHRTGHDSMSIICRNMAGDVLAEFIAFDPRLPVSSFVALVQERLAAPPRIQWQFVLPDAKLLGALDLDVALADLFGWEQIDEAEQ